MAVAKSAKGPAPAKSATKAQPAPATKAQSAPAAKRPQDAAGDEVASKSRPIEEFPDLVDVLPDLCVEYREVSEKMAKLEARRKELSAQIMPLMEAVEYDSIRGDGWLALRVRGGQSRISKEKLLEKGVSMQTIEACTTKTSYYYVQVREATAV